MNIPSESHVRIPRIFSRLLPGLMALGLSACVSNAELQERTDSRNEKFTNRRERGDIRRDARDERYEAMYDAVMD